MPITINPQDGILVCEFVGRVTGAELLKSAAEVREIEDREAVTPARLVDLCGMTAIDLDFDTVSSFAAMRKRSELKNTTKSALVTANDVQFGFARMYQSLNQNPHLRVEIFKDRSQGLQWVKS